MTVEVVDVVLPPIEIVDVTPLDVELREVVAGPPGPRGPAGTGLEPIEFPVPEATWTISHSLGRKPVVYLIVDGHPFDAPTFISETHVVVTWPFPVAGTAFLI